MTEDTVTGRRSVDMPLLAPLGFSPVPPSPSSTALPPAGLSPLAEIVAPAAAKVLDFDIETVAAGFADPAWVPHTITAWAYQWVDEDELTSAVLPPRSFFNTKARARFLRPLLQAIREADMVTGHNLLRFDLPIVNAEAMRLNLELLPAMRVQDTMRLRRVKGFKKGQDNIGVLLGVDLEKKALNWQEWQDAYGEPDLATVRERNEGDVRQHLEVRRKALARGWLRPPVMWRP